MSTKAAMSYTRTLTRRKTVGYILALYLRQSRNDIHSFNQSIAFIYKVLLTSIFKSFKNRTLVYHCIPLSLGSIYKYTLRDIYCPVSFRIISVTKYAE